MLSIERFCDTGYPLEVNRGYLKDAGNCIVNDNDDSIGDDR